VEVDEFGSNVLILIVNYAGLVLTCSDAQTVQ